jgi:hypothetical protein
MRYHPGFDKLSQPGPSTSAATPSGGRSSTAGPGPAPDAGPEADEQLDLRYRIAGRVADEQVVTGFTVVLQDVIPARRPATS